MTVLMNIIVTVGSPIPAGGEMKITVAEDVQTTPWAGTK
jgi:hypothetical protein